MPKPRKTINCQHCGKEFTQARKDQKYCSAPCRFEHFFEARDNEKARLEEQIEELKAMVNERDARIVELEAQLQAARTPKKPKSKTLEAHQ